MDCGARVSIVAALLAIGLAALYFADRVTIARLLAAHELERARNDEAVAKLLDRIQFPEVRQVTAMEPVDHEMPDAAEYAMVGLEVPEHVNVGENGAS